MLVAGSAMLWKTWYDLKEGTDPQKLHNLPVISIAVDAQTAFLVYSIVATVLTVRLSLHYW